MALPVEVQQNTSLFGLNEKLKSLRGELTVAESQLQSGTYKIKKLLQGLTVQLFDVIDEMTKTIETLVIPKNKFDDFLNGLATLSEFASFETLEFYNSLKLLRLAYHGLKAAVDLIRETPTVPLAGTLNNAGGGILESLDDTEFTLQGFQNPIQERETRYSFYTIRQNDTLQSIAAKFFNGDYTRWREIASANDISENDLIDQSAVGISIKIPQSGGGSPIADRNAVYEPQYGGTDQDGIDQFFFGRDIKLVRKRFVINGRGDLSIQKGRQNLADAIRRRFENRRGSLNPLHPDWGLYPPIDYADSPKAIVLERIIRDMEVQAMTDPRIVVASADPSTFKLEGDALRADMKLVMIGEVTATLSGVAVPSP